MFATKSQEEAKSRLLNDVEDARAHIVALQRQIEMHNDTISRLVQHDSGDLTEDIRRQTECNNRDIAAEDALDTIVRLENALKIAQRRNALLGREQQRHEKLLKDRSKVLEKLTKEEDELRSATGWTGESHVEHDVQGRIGEMVKVEQVVNRELVGAAVLVKKKQQLVETLEVELSKKKEKEEFLLQMFNDIRVKDRDVKEMEVRVQKLRDEHEKNQSLIEVAKSKQATLSIHSLQEDTQSLKRTVEQHRETRRHQEDIIKAQVFRASQLQTRIDIVTAALQDLKLGKEFERSVPKSSLVPATSFGEPQSASEVVPADEQVAMSLFKLLLRDHDSMRTNVARKDVMLLEKEATVQALEAKLEGFTHSLNLSTEQQDSLKVHKTIEMDELQEALQQQHQEYRRQIDELLRSNAKLKARLMKAPPMMPQHSKMRY